MKSSIFHGLCVNVCVCVLHVHLLMDGIIKMYIMIISFTAETVKYSYHVNWNICKCESNRKINEIKGVKTERCTACLRCRRCVTWWYSLYQGKNMAFESFMIKLKIKVFTACCSCVLLTWFHRVKTKTIHNRSFIPPSVTPGQSSL